MNRHSIVIIGVGNYLMSDEGVGVHAAGRLSKLNWPEDVEIIDGGTPGVGLIHLIKDRKLAIIIDCADFGGKPGEIATFNPDDLERDRRKEISLHATDLLSALDLARSTGNYPKEILIIGIQPEKIEMGTSLSSNVQKSLEKLREIIENKIEKA